MIVHRKILHLDMDAFFASVEQAADPRLQGKPLVVGGRPDRERTVVCAASYEAKRLGIDSGMSCREAFRICPQAAFVAADSAKYLYISNQIALLLRDYSPQVEQASIDEFYLDVTGCDEQFGSYLELGMHIKNTIRTRFHITGSIGVSINRLMSKIASKLRKPDGMLIMDEPDIAGMLAGLPVEKIPGIGVRLSRRLHELSIFSFADLRKFPRELLVEKFGKLGMWMYGVAHPQSTDEEDIRRYDRPQAPPKSVGHSYTLPRTAYTREEVEAWLRLLCEMVGRRLRRYGREARSIHVYLRRPDFEYIGRENNFSVPSNDPAELFRRAVCIMRRLHCGNFPVRALGITARGLMPAVSSPLFLSEQKRRRLNHVQDALNERYGEWAVYPASIMLTKRSY